MLDRQVELGAGVDEVALVARREEGGRMSFELQPGLGEWVPRPEWEEEWGGGVSAENPHVQRARYPGLVLQEFLARQVERADRPVTG